VRARASAATRGRSAPDASSAETASARRPSLARPRSSLTRPRSSLARRRAGRRMVEPDRAGPRSLHRFTEKAHGSRNSMRVQPMTSTGTSRGHGSDFPTRPEDTRRAHAAPWPSLGALGRPCLRATCSSNRAPADRLPRSENGTCAAASRGGAAHAPGRLRRPGRAQIPDDPGARAHRARTARRRRGPRGGWSALGGRATPESAAGPKNAHRELRDRSSTAFAGWRSTALEMIIRRAGPL